MKQERALLQPSHLTVSSRTRRPGCCPPPGHLCSAGLRAECLGPSRRPACPLPDSLEGCVASCRAALGEALAFLHHCPVPPPSCQDTRQSPARRVPRARLTASLDLGSQHLTDTPRWHRRFTSTALVQSPLTLGLEVLFVTQPGSIWPLFSKKHLYCKPLGSPVAPSAGRSTSGEVSGALPTPPSSLSSSGRPCREVHAPHTHALHLSLTSPPWKSCAFTSYNIHLALDHFLSFAKISNLSLVKTVLSFGSYNRTRKVLWSLQQGSI